MNITLERYRKKQDWIDGRLHTNIGYLADTLENRNAALPAGKYVVQIIKCKQHARKMPVLMLSTEEGAKPDSMKQKCSKCKRLADVYNNTTLPRYCPQICPDNGVHNRKDGAIIVGKFYGYGSLVHPKSTFDRIYGMLRKTTERGNQIVLTIIERCNKTDQKR